MAKRLWVNSLEILVKVKDDIIHKAECPGAHRLDRHDLSIKTALGDGVLVGTVKVRCQRCRRYSVVVVKMPEEETA